MEEEMLEQEQQQDMPVEAPESVSEPLSQESNTMAQGQVESPVREAPREPVQKMQVPPLVFGDDTTIELDFSDVQSFLPVQITEQARDRTVSPSLIIMQDEMLEPPKTEAEESALVQSAVEKVKAKRDASIKQETETLVASSEDVSTTIAAVDRYNRESSKPVTVADINVEAVRSMYQPTEDIYLEGAESIANNIRLSQLAQKAEQQIWDETGWFGIVLDTVYAMTPVGVVAERYDKAKVAGAGPGDSILNFLTLGGSVEDLAGRIWELPTDQREAAVLAIIEEIKQQEMLFFMEGNSLLRADQISILAEELRNGFLAASGVSRAESLDTAFGSLDVLFGVGAWTRSGRNMIRGMLGKLMPSDDTRVLAGTRPNKANLGDTKRAADPVTARRAAAESGGAIKAVKAEGNTDFGTASRFIPVRASDEDATVVASVEYRGKMIPVSDMEKMLDTLELRTTGKMSRGDRKAMDAERKRVGSEIAGLESNPKSFIEERMRVYQAQGNTVKQARNKAKKDVSVRLHQLRDERDYLNRTIRQSDSYAKAEAEASRMRQALQGEVVYTPKSAVANTAPIIKALDESEVKVFDEAVNTVVRGVDDAGTLVDDVPEDLKWSAPDAKDIQDSIRDIGQAQLVDPSNYRNAEIETARTLEKMTGSSLKHNPAMTVWRQNDDLDSIGDFRIYLGNGDTGFDTAEEAAAVGRTALGENLKPVEINGRWYLEKEFRHKFNSRRDVGLIDEAKVTSVNPLVAWFINPLRRLGDSNLVDVWGNVEVNRAIARDVLDPAKKALKRLKEGELADVSKLLSNGDEQQRVFTKREAFVELGRAASDKVMEAYYAVRKVFDMHYDVLNNNVRKSMERAGWKAARAGDETFYGDVLTRNTAMGLGDRVYDSRIGAVRSIDELEPDDVIIRSYTMKVTDNGSKHRLIVVNPEDVGELPANVVSKREGHVTRIYADRKFKIVEEVEDVVDGRTITRTRTIGITRLEAEAEDLLNSIRDKHPNAVITRTLENPADDTEAFLEELGDIGYSPTNSRQRGSQLLGVGNNPARVADPLESAALVSLKIERELNKDVVEALESKFLNTWGRYLVNPTDAKKPMLTFPKEGQIVFKQDAPVKVQRQIRNFHEYIVNMDNIRQGKVAEYFNSAMVAVEEALYRGTGRRLPEALQRVVDGDAQRGFMKLATYAYIIGRPLFQIPTNLLQIANIMIRYPLTGSKSAARALGVAAALAGRNSDDFGAMWKAFGKTGYSEQEAKMLLDLIEETGIVRTTAEVNDFIGLTKDGLRSQASSTILGRSSRNLGRALTSPLRMTVNASSKLQEASISYVNLVAIITEFDNALARGVKMTAKAKSDILMKARKLTQTQNSLDRFGYQDGHNPLQMMFQFVQHVNKLFLDIAVEPIVKTVTGRGIVKGNEGIFADSRAVALRTTALTMALFGMNGLPVGSDVSGRATNYLREMMIDVYGKDLPDEVWDLVQGGLINMMINSMIDGKVDVTARVSPSALVDMVADMFNDMSLDVLGAAGGMTETVFDIAHASYVLSTNPDLSSYEKASGILRETASFFSGFKDYEKAKIARTWLTQPYMSTLSGPMRVTYEEAVFSLFSINPKSVEDLYRNADFSSGGDKSHAEKVSRVMIRQMNRELTDLKAAGMLEGNEGFFRLLDVQRKWVHAAKAHVDSSLYDDVYSEFEFYMIRENGQGFRSFIRDYMEGKTLESQVRSLKRLREEVQFEDYRDIIDNMIYIMEGQ